MTATWYMHDPPDDETVALFRAEHGMTYSIGNLAQDNYDPTYGDSPVTAGAQVFDCTYCHSLTIRPNDHATHHINNQRQETA